LTGARREVDLFFRMVRVVYSYAGRGRVPCGNVKMADANVQDTITNVGPSVARSMASVGVHTVGDLLRFKGIVPGIRSPRLRKFQEQAKALMGSCGAAAESRRQPESVVKKHTWCGQTMHFPHGRGLYVGVVGDMLVKGPLVGMVVRFENAAGRTQMCAVSPQTLSALHLLWLQNDVASDDSDDDHIRPEVQPVRYKLPPLLVDPAEMHRFPAGAPQRLAIKFALREVNQVYHLVRAERLLPLLSPPASPARSEPPTPVRSWADVPSPHPSRGRRGPSYDL
jgi:hypothetical protein